MKTICCFLLFSIPFIVFSQQSDTATAGQPPKKQGNSLGLGIKAGLNFTNVTGPSSINNQSETGYQAGLILDPKSTSILGSRTELLYSHQSYNYATGKTTGTVFLNYLMLAQLMRINFTRFFQIQIGTQIAYLMNAKADSNQVSTGNASADAALDYYNRIDFGFSGGVEVRPFMGILIGARYNLSVTNLYKMPTATSGQTPPSFIPTTGDVNFKNNLFQLYVGYRF